MTTREEASRTPHNRSRSRPASRRQVDDRQPPGNAPTQTTAKRTGTEADQAQQFLGRPTPPPGFCPRPRDRASLTAYTVEHLEAEVLSLAERLAVGTYELLVLVGELDARGSWAAWGALSCAAWLADTCDIEMATARTQVRVARAMRRFPQLDAAMASGELSYAKARVLTPCLSDHNAEALLAIATTTPSARLGAAIAAWLQRHDDQETIRQRQHDARSLAWRTEPDGTVLLTARLPPEVAAEACAVVDALVARSHAPVGASLAQQRADALAVALTAPAGGGIMSEVIVHVRDDGNALPDGTPLSDHAVASMLPASFVSLLLHDSERHPIDASPRRRFPTRRQRRVLDEIDRECAHPGCHATAFLQYDHIEPYAEGGPTVIANLQRLCGPHNRARTWD